MEGMKDRGVAVVDRVEVDADSSPGLAVEATIMSTASSNSRTPVRRQNHWRQILVSGGPSTAVPTPEGGPKRNRRPRPTARCPTVNGAGERATWPGPAGHRRDSKGPAAPVASTAIGCVTAFETNLPRTLTSLLPL